MEETGNLGAEQLPPPEKPNKNNPFKSGFVPTGKRRGTKPQSYLAKKNLLRYMLDVDITAQDLPQKLADDIRAMIPGFIENVERKFTLRQIMELVQVQLLFSKSDYVKQGAIEAIKNRVEGKPLQKIQMETIDAEPTEFVLSNGRKLVI